jgi:phage anti-repressor protein
MELIKVATNAQGNQVVSASDLHSFLGIKTEKVLWCKRMFEYGFEENKDFAVIKSENPVNQQVTVLDYALTLDCAKEISMIQRSDKGKEARQYFIECERKLKQNLLPATYIDALKALVASEEAKEQALLQVGNLNTVLDNLLDWVSIIKIARFNKVKENYFNWRVLKAKSEELGYSIKKAESPRFGYQNLYHLTVFKACYPELNYNIK